MKAFEIENERLALCERPVPECEDAHVLIETKAAGVNRPDIFQRKGHYPPPPGVTDIPGLEVAGIVRESRHPNWNGGDRVCALVPGGGYAELVSANGDHCLPVPKNMSFEKASAIPETFFTVWNNLYYRNTVKPGSTVLIHGGSSGIGTAAIQIVHVMGAVPYITAGNAEKCEACLSIGAQEAINYKEEDFVERIQDITDGRGVDVVLDMVGGEYIERNLSCLAAEGLHISIAHLQGAKGTYPVRDVMLKRLTLTGSTLRARPAKEKADIAAGLKENIWPKLESGDITPVIDRVFPFEDAMKAHATLEKGDHIGKIVLTHAGQSH